MGAKLSRFKRRRVEGRIKDAGKMQNVVNAFKTTSKASSSKVHPIDRGRFSPVSQDDVREIAKEATWRKYFKTGEKAPQRDFEELIQAREIEQERITSSELHSTPSKARNIVYENMCEEEVYTECYFCRMVTGDTTVDCRICGRIAHLSCLQSRGFLGSENQLLAAKQAQQGSPIGWSCPECEDVSQLLSADEMQELMERFDQYDKNGDNEFNFEDFLQQSHPIPKMTEEANNPADRLKEFSEYDRDEDNTVTWEEFKLLEALRILRKASQSYLVRSLKPQEIEKIKNSFRDLDTFNTGVITMQASRLAFQTWTKTVGYNIPKLVANTKDTDFSLISWDRFIREHAFHVICARPNAVTIRHYLSSFDLT